MPRTGLIACFFVIVCFVFSSVLSAGEKATVMRLMGKAEILKAGEWQPAHAGHKLERGESVRVIGPGEVTVRTANGKVLITGKDDTVISYSGEVDVQTNPWKNARLAQAGGFGGEVGAKTVSQFYSPQGEVGVQVTPGETLNLVTPLITASVRGTSFSMRVGEDSSSSVGVCGGSVLSYSRTGDVRYVCPGQETSTTAREYTVHLSKLGYCLPEGADWREYDPTVFEEVDRRVLGKWFPKDL